MKRAALALLLLSSTAAGADPESDFAEFFALYCKPFAAPAGACQSVVRFGDTLHLHLREGYPSPALPITWRAYRVTYEMLPNVRAQACKTYGRIMPGVC